MRANRKRSTTPEEIRPSQERSPQKPKAPTEFKNYFPTLVKATQDTSFFASVENVELHKTHSVPANLDNEFVKHLPPLHIENNLPEKAATEGVYYGNIGYLPPDKLFAESPPKKRSFFSRLFKQSPKAAATKLSATYPSKSDQFPSEISQLSLAKTLRKAVTEDLKLASETTASPEKHQLLVAHSLDKITSLLDSFAQQEQQLVALENKHFQLVAALPTAKEINYTKNTAYLNNLQFQLFDRFYSGTLSKPAETMCQENANVYFLRQLKHFADKRSQLLQPQIEELISLIYHNPQLTSASQIKQAVAKLAKLSAAEKFYLKLNLADLTYHLNSLLESVESPKI